MFGVRKIDLSSLTSKSKNTFILTAAPLDRICADALLAGSATLGIDDQVRTST